MPTVSVIIPIYKVEKYLRRCVDSVLTQTFIDFELILVDDGSPDGCPSICDEYAEQDARVRVIHQKNAGVSAARNAALNIAKGEFVVFVDSDDWVDPEYLEKLMIGDEDLIVHSRWTISQQTGAKTLRIYNEYVGKVTYPQDISGFFLNNALNNPIAKRYSMRIINENGLRFNEELSCREDHLFNVQYVKYVKTIRVENIAKYWYVVYPKRDTLSTTVDKDYITKRIKADELILREVYPNDETSFNKVFNERLKTSYCSLSTHIRRHGTLFSYMKFFDFLSNDDDFVRFLSEKNHFPFPNFLKKAMGKKQKVVMFFGALYLRLADCKNDFQKMFKKQMI